MELGDLVKQLPKSPGIYRMMDSSGNIIYVGKAKNLKNRVSQYFQSRKDLSPKIVEMIQRIHTIGYTVTDTELDAFIEECRLIKEIKPQYNKQMKSDKNYSYIRIPDEKYPKVYVVTEKSDDNALYFGPFNSQHRVECAVEYLNSFFPIRKCTSPGFTRKANGCLFLQLGTCSGACTGRVSPDEYVVYIKKIQQLLNGNDAASVQELQAKMDKAVEELEFEKAVKYREYQLGLRHVIGKQKLVLSSGKNRNIVAVEHIDTEHAKLFFIKGNKLLYRHLIDISKIDSKDSINELSNNLFDAYADVKHIDGRLTQQDVDEAQIIHIYLRQHKNNIAAFWVPSYRLEDKTAGLEETVSRILNRAKGN